jgi:hypothetical protein
VVLRITKRRKERRKYRLKSREGKINKKESSLK